MIDDEECPALSRAQRAQAMSARWFGSPKDKQKTRRVGEAYQAVVPPAPHRRGRPDSNALQPTALWDPSHAETSASLKAALDAVEPRRHEQVISAARSRGLSSDDALAGMLCVRWPVQHPMRVAPWRQGKVLSWQDGPA